MSNPSQPTIKRLFAVSGNKCAFPKCPLPLVDVESGSVIAQVCHIKGKNSGSARYDISQTNAERDAFENLILMCSVHHKVIDDDEISYTVERLQALKASHETKPVESDEQGKLEKLLEEHLLLLKTQNGNVPDSKSFKEENSALMQAQKLAQEINHKSKTQQWLSSYDGLADGINSIRELFDLIDKRFVEYSDTFQTLGVQLISEEKLRSIQNFKFGCVVYLEGYEKHLTHNNRLANFSLTVRLFRKKQHFANGHFTSEEILMFFLKPDLSMDEQVIWQDKDNKRVFYTAETLCEKFFSLFIKQIEQKDSDYEENYNENNDDFYYGNNWG